MYYRKQMFEEGISISMPCYPETIQA